MMTYIAKMRMAIVFKTGLKIYLRLYLGELVSFKNIERSLFILSCLGRFSWTDQDHLWLWRWVAAWWRTESWFLKRFSLKQNINRWEWRRRSWSVWGSKRRRRRRLPPSPCSRSRAGEDHPEDEDDTLLDIQWVNVGAQLPERKMPILIFLVIFGESNLPWVCSAILPQHCFDFTEVRATFPLGGSRWQF